MPENIAPKDNIFIEKSEKIRLLIEQNIGLEKVLDKIREKYKVGRFLKDGEIIILVEEKEEDKE